jgi:hypothetical protein
MAVVKLSKQMRGFLKWCDLTGEFATWPIEWHFTMPKAKAAGFVEPCGRESGVMGLQKYRLTALGRDASKL